MAKQAGIIPVRGCVGGVSFYKLGGQYYVRRKSSLTGKRVKQDQAFAKTMLYAGLLAKASVIASGIYQQLPKTERKVGDYRKIVGNVMQELKRESSFFSSFDSLSN